MFEIDAKFPKQLHNTHNDLPFLPAGMLTEMF